MSTFARCPRANGRRSSWSGHGARGQSVFGYNNKVNHMANAKRRAGIHRGYNQTRMTQRFLRADMFTPGREQERMIKKAMWGDFADQFPVSVHYQPGAINSTDPNDQEFIRHPCAPEFAGSYEAHPWVVPEAFPDKHPLTRMPAPVRNVVAQSERSQNYWSKDSWYSMAEGEVLTPFEVIETEFRRVGLWMKGGRHWAVLAGVVVSNGNGTVGLGMGEERTYDKARQAAIENAFGNLVAIDPRDGTVPHPMHETFYRSSATILPARTLQMGGSMADIFSGIGLKGATAMVRKPSHKKYKKMLLVLSLLRSMRSKAVIAQQRGLSRTTMASPLMTYFENVRRKRGMFELSPEGIKGGTSAFLPPNRVVDNRMPDHLKRRYFAGTDDEAFGDVVASETFRLDVGTERYGKRNVRYLNLEHETADPVADYNEAAKAIGSQQSDPSYEPAWTRGVQSRAREQWLM